MMSTPLNDESERARKRIEQNEKKFAQSMQTSFAAGIIIAVISTLALIATKWL